LWADASTNLKYARIQQEGGVIRPKNAKALWIPAGPETRRLMTRYGATTPARLVAAMGADGYGFYKTGGVFVAYKKGRKLKTGREGKPGKAVLLFYIRSSVTIPARPFLYIDDRDHVYFTNLVRMGIINELKKNTRETKK
jgi:phage gpG-like protein